MKTLVIGSINQDLVTITKKRPKDGETLYGDSFAMYLGGKGANQAIALAKLGGDALFFGAIGKDTYGENAIKSIKNYNIDTSLILKKETSTGIATIVVSEGENSIIVVPGANHQITKNDIDKIKDIISNVDMVLFQLELPIEIIKYAIKLTKDLGKKTILNIAPFMNIDDEIYKNCDLLILNEVEFSSFAKSKGVYEDDCIDRLLNFGIKEIILTKGSKGCELHTKEGKKEFSSYKMSNVIDTTGAGDCFIGALISKISKGKTIEKAIDFASKAAAISVTRCGATSSMPSEEEVENYLF